MKVLDEYELKSNLYELISSAAQNVVLISPFLGKDFELIRLLNEAKLKNVNVTIYSSVSTESSNAHMEMLLALKQNDIPIILSNVFHAKIYYSESTMIVSSLNLSSFYDRFEIGFLFDSYFDDLIYQKILTLVETNLINRHIGYCICCGCKIDYNISRPFCKKCYYSLRRTDRDYEPFTYCHKCGRVRYINNSLEITRFQPKCFDCR